MILGIGKEDDRPLIFAGITAEDIQALKDGIVLRGAMGGAVQIAIMSGESEESIAADLKRLGVIPQESEL